VRGLASILRLADGLDRTRFAVVKRLQTDLTPDGLSVRIDAGGADAELELWAARRRADLLERLLGRPVTLKVAEPGWAEAAAPAVARRRA
jgi:exopolyphosphatase/guanosine-5'-triphosphate,3'-diphosphate pyrophosphatase